MGRHSPVARSLRERIRHEPAVPRPLGEHRRCCGRAGSDPAGLGGAVRNGEERIRVQEVEPVADDLWQCGHRSDPEPHEHVVGCRRDGGVERAAGRGGRQSVQVRVAAAVDGVDGVVDRELRHRHVLHAHGRRLPRARNRSIRCVEDRGCGMRIPVAYRVADHRRRRRLGTSQKHGDERRERQGGSECSKRRRPLRSPTHLPPPSCPPDGSDPLTLPSVRLPLRTELTPLSFPSKPRPRRRGTE